MSFGCVKCSRCGWTTEDVAEMTADLKNVANCPQCVGYRRGWNESIEAATKILREKEFGWRRSDLMDSKALTREIVAGEIQGLMLPPSPKDEGK